MLIYQNKINQFIEDVRQNVISDKMIFNFESRWNRKPGAAEVASWQNSLSKVRDLVEVAELADNMIALEYEVPYNQCRIDCLLFGRSSNAVQNVVLIELKQWSGVKELPDEGNFVETYTGGSEHVVPHPAQQVKGYHNYLKGFVSEFEVAPELTLFSCAYCHNYGRQDGLGLFAPIYKEVIAEFPVYTKEDVKPLAAKLKTLLQAGKGFEIFNRFMQSPLKPSKKLLENVTKVIKNEVVFSLLNEQLVAKNLIWSKVRNIKKRMTKSVIIVQGGPGTGKSLIAINVLAEAAQKGQQVFYGCKSKPFTEGLRKLVGKDGAMLFSNLYRFVPSKIKENQLDLLLVDEAHRIEKKSNHQYMRVEDRTDLPQIEQLIRCAKTSVFFIDDKQNVRSQEIGHSDLIRQAASKFKCELAEVALLTQYRCMGSNNYLLWLESALGYEVSSRILSKNEVFDFRIFDSPTSLYKELAKHEKVKPNSARMVAGFCWPWSKKLDSNGELIKDVKIGEFAMAWETHGDITRPPKGYVKWFEWAYRPEGFKQVGCIYTAQGFEFDYVGVIIGDDIRYDKATNRLVGNMTATKDATLRRSAENFELHVKNIYRTLLTRGMRGCYVYFCNKDTENFFRSRMASQANVPNTETAPLLPPIPSQLEVTEFYPYVPQIVTDPGRKKFVSLVPLYTLEAAAGSFGEPDAVDCRGWVKVPSGIKINQRHFVAKVVGKSMEPKIKDGSYCLFTFGVIGSRNGRIVLAQHSDISDPETGGSYTIKKYLSKKTTGTEGEWKHTAIQLLPINPDFKPIEITADSADDIKIIAEFVTVLEP
jgi:uncharacterized protein